MLLDEPWSPQRPKCYPSQNDLTRCLAFHVEDMDFSQHTALGLVTRSSTTPPTFCYTPLSTSLVPALLRSTTCKLAPSRWSACLAACLQNRTMHSMILCCQKPSNWFWVSLGFSPVSQVSSVNVIFHWRIKPLWLLSYISLLSPENSRVFFSVLEVCVGGGRA